MYFLHKDNKKGTYTLLTLLAIALINFPLSMLIHNFLYSYFTILLFVASCVGAVIYSIIVFERSKNQEMDYIVRAQVALAILGSMTLVALIIIKLGDDLIYFTKIFLQGLQ